MIWFVLSAAAAPPSEAPEGVPQLPITEIDHPRYVDAAGEPVSWSEVRTLAVGTGALGRVRQRRIGRTLVRITFAAATAVEVWGTMELARPIVEGVPDSWFAVPLGAQATLTGLCGVLSWTRAPQDRMEDRAIVLDAVNAVRAPSQQRPR